MGRTKYIEEDIKKKVLINYLEKQMSLINSGKEFQLSQRQVENILKEFGVKKRTYTEAKQLGRKYPCNDSYFKVQNHNMAYILGLIASDGCVSKKENLISIQLQTKDRELLEEIKTETNNSRPINDYIRPERNECFSTFRVWSKAWKDDLSHYGIIPEKTFKLTPPNLLMPDYYIDYIRGYFDGDGSIYFLKDTNRIFVEIVGTSKILIDWIRDKLVNNYHIFLNREVVEHKDNGTIIYKIKIGSKEEIYKLYKLFYQNNSLCLKRKKEKFELLLNIPRDSNSFNKE